MKYAILPLALLMLASATPAAAATIASYDIYGAFRSTVGGWSHTYNGNVTALPGGLVALTGGTSGTLNDGYVPRSADNNNWFCAGACTTDSQTGNSVTNSPVIGLRLDGLYKLNSIDFLSDYFGNVIPGQIATLDVTVNGLTKNIQASNYGPIGGSGYGLNQRAELLNAFNGTVTNFITLSNFTTHYKFIGADYFSIGELVVNGDPVNVMPAVPEPATWALMIGGFGLVGGAMRRRNSRATTVRVAYS